MAKPRESAADRLWREKIEACASWREAVLMLALAVAVATALLFG
jgi:hypothetical protein